MRIDRLTVRNFRNLADVDIHLLPGTVIVGENRAGKSNLIYALRLVFDPSLSYADRQLRREDFWDGGPDAEERPDPMAQGEVIEISVEIADFENDSRVICALGNALVAEEPMRARLTFRFAPVDTGDPNGNRPLTYRGRVYGGHDMESPLAADWRNYLYSLFLHALRDVESDIRAWRRSPLRTLLEAASSSALEADLGDVKAAMKNANDQLNQLEVIKELAKSINTRLVDMVGTNQAVETELAAAPDDPLRLIRAMRIYVDGEAHRNLASASLGTLNILYLALLELGLGSRLYDSEIAHVVMGIEEPEAHLHPHLQRLVFRRLLREQQESRTVLVTTQSPHIASVADPRSLVALRTIDGKTSAAAAHTANLADAEWDDIRRYLDATRAELVFARRVLLVEGYAEQVLIPRLALALDLDLDKLGITVCSINGVHFTSYVQFCQALEIPWAVVTDGDPDAAGQLQGEARAADLCAAMQFTRPRSDEGIFVGGDTFEYDLIGVEANIAACLSTLRALCAAPSQAVIDSWRNRRPSRDDYMRIIDNAGGKGRFAQRLSTKGIHPPEYIADALRYLEAQ
jgi:putative ATP-dependent endonuclease of the OLD family